MTKEDLGHLIIASTDSLYRISKSILRNETDCEDAVSEAIVKSFDKINTLQHASYAKTWLVRILINECYRIYRQKQFALSNDFTFKENLMALNISVISDGFSVKPKRMVSIRMSMSEHLHLMD